jgi:hypothetical protein
LRRDTFSTPYPEVNAALEELLARAREALVEHFVGLYLYGSLAAGDFRLDRSDIDFVVVTEGPLPELIVAVLRKMHESLWASGSYWAQRLEGAYIPRDELHRHSPEYPPRPTVNEGQFYLAGEDADWVFHRYVLREYETIVAGPSIRDLIDPIRPEELRGAARDLLQQWWHPMLQNPKRLWDPGYSPYAVLSLCRALYTLKHGAIASKSQAARWGLSTLDPQWHDLIQWALDWRNGQPSDRVAETLEFLRLTVEYGAEQGAKRAEEHR